MLQKDHPADFPQIRLPSQGLNTGSNPVGTTTPYAVLTTFERSLHRRRFLLALLLMSYAATALTPLAAVVYVVRTQCAVRLFTSMVGSIFYGCT